jgi:hypothetical protein
MARAVWTGDGMLKILPPTLSSSVSLGVVSTASVSAWLSVEEDPDPPQATSKALEQDPGLSSLTMARS